MESYIFPLYWMWIFCKVFLTQYLNFPLYMKKVFYYVIMATVPKILVQMSKTKFENLYTR